MLSPHVAQRCRLPLRQVRAGLAALTQLRLIQHHSDLDGFSAYQANLPKAYELLRIGKLTDLAQKSHGLTAAQVVQALASVGYSNPSDLVAAVKESIQAEGREGDVGDLEDVILSSMRSLADNGSFARLQPAQLQVQHDARQDADEHLLKHPPATEAKLKGKKAQDQHFGFVDDELERRTDDYLSPHTLQASLDASTQKASGPRSDDLQICVNYSTAVKALRNSIVSQHASKVFGESFSKVAGAVMTQLDLTAPAISATSIPDQHQVLSLSRIVEQLKQPEVNASRPHTNGWHHDDDMTNGVEEMNGNVGHDELHQSLLTLAEGPCSFLKDRHDGTWAADKMELRKFIVRQEIMKIARQRVGPIGVRLLRIIIDKGRIDEKMLQEIGLLNAREMRQDLGRLHQGGFIEVQEVPRDPQRQPNRTIFLWFYDEGRVERKLLEDIYKSMARLYQRLQLERGKMKLTLEKVEHEDCEGREEDFMSAAELTLLLQFRRKETWLLGEIMRLDDSVALLRDL